MEELEVYERVEFRRTSEAWDTLHDLYESLDPEEFEEERGHILAVRIMLSTRLHDLLEVSE